ncbi:hypothetical protein MJO29_012568 [Puccinia striiformis f. sp. tritici]|uniref:Uncharacterized protein n=3 Tax=Puccinia striiformis TaxID=27350 RepID=A0A0L0VD46_9BASI|nr:hypothetical protein MJO29_012568 [Puccinia striiformis f. sp. tritici]KAI9631077.1 hypothetical protein KEM48_013335 [Puccinia striiformis f. sp. tritici PST-130]KNE97213.1 hypothetical protein PSTG_09474 [Puccinia striiformis f. sp. tritici PST-78]POV98432.1 hypothetical protein PSTT_14433 [Puccinia striiformis]POW05595.1 hypothetical protein PSHT_10725 [Puccinia striiformis]
MSCAHDSSSPDPKLMYRDVISRYENNSCDFGAFVTASTRVSIILSASNICDSGTTSYFTDDTIAAIGARENLSSTSSPGHRVVSSAFDACPIDSATTVDPQILTEARAPSSTVKSKPFAPGFLLPKPSMTRRKNKSDSVHDVACSPGNDSIVSTEDTSFSECKPSLNESTNKCIVHSAENSSFEQSENESPFEVADPVKVLNEIYSKAKPDPVPESCKTRKRFIHLPVPTSCYLGDAIRSAMTEYPLSQRTDVDELKELLCFTSYVIVTDPSYDRHASVKIFTDLSRAIDSLIDKSKIFRYLHSHNENLNNIVQTLLKQYSTIIVQIDNNYTNLHKDPPHKIYASRLIPRHVNRHLQILTTFADTERSYRATNHTVYDSQQLLITGMANSRYNINGFALRMTAPNIVETDSHISVLCDLSHISEIDLDANN